jgi:ribonuclease R
LSNKTKGVEPLCGTIPSREQASGFSKRPASPHRDELIARLGVTDAKTGEGFERRLGAMERDGQILRNRRG